MNKSILGITATFAAIMLLAILITTASASCASASTTEDVERITAERDAWKAAYHRRDDQYWASRAYSQRLEVRVWSLVESNTGRLQGWQRANQKALKYKAMLRSSVFMPNRAYTRAELYTMARIAGWPERLLPWLYRVTTCESGRRWWAQNGSYIGILQNHHNNNGLQARHFNTMITLKSSLELYNQRGPQPWECK